MDCCYCCPGSEAYAHPPDCGATPSWHAHDAVTRVYDEAGNVTETHKHKGEFKEP